ncbi:DUF3667 domain-containing protein [Glacieibacterium frigidum]|uniref:DUF3667 domain-containing protein n=1 Tax=Glacieibacterium frigidum TaxID=2593303 RepID=A0A552U966_9SPHN|nr:DUF3667 domain-containing protein [Glacieibacterium frigidum]TRW14752.1 DUF3667 domain-containing protein [Glacieibacterium frigidum]
MSNEIEAFGALATAGLAASELDKPSVRRRLAREAAAEKARWWKPKKAAHVVEGHTEGACANCETVLVGDFCHACGQQGHVHRSVGHVFEEFLHGIWHFDSKAWRTLPLLAFRPGKLTWDYIHGKRARYIAPIALFLLSMFLMFFVFGFVGAPDFGSAPAKGSNVQTVADAREAVDGIKADIVGSEVELAEAKTGGDAETIRTASNNLAAERLALRIAEANLRRFETAEAKQTDGKGKLSVEPGKVEVQLPAKSWKEELAEQARTGQLNINSGIPGANENIRKALENPDFALYRIQQKAYKLSFLLIPLSLPVLWLMFFWRRDTTTYDHVVFTLYSLSFMSLLLVLAVLLVKATNALEGMGGPAIGSIGLLTLVPPVHMYFQLKGGYRLSTWGALWRAAVLSQATIVILALFATLIVILGLAD